MDSDKKLFLSLFVAQVIASFLVLAGHYTADVYSYIQGTSWEMNLNQISRYGTVFLAILTGLFTAHSFAVKKTTIKSFFAGKIQFIFIPFLLSGVLYNWMLLDHLPMSFVEVINILLGKTGGHLYFIFMLCQYYLFAYLVRNWVTKSNIFRALFLFLIIQFVFIKMNSSYLGLGVRHFLPTWIFTLYLGHAFYEYRHSIMEWLESNKVGTFILGLVGLGSVLYFIADPQVYTANHLRFVFSSFILLLITVFLVKLIVDKVSIRFQKGLTFYVYLLHPFFIDIFNQLFIKQLRYEWLFHNKWYSFFYCVTIWAATLLISTLISDLIVKMSKLKAKPVIKKAS